MLMMTPAALYAQLVIAANNRRCRRRCAPPPPLGLALLGRRRPLLRADRLRASGDRPPPARGSRAALPPGLRDAALLGGTVFDLLERERGADAAISLAFTRPEGSPGRALEHAFAGRS